MQNKIRMKSIICLILVYFLLSGILFWVVRDSWTQQTVSTENIQPLAYCGDFSNGATLTQTFTPASDTLSEISLRAASYGGSSEGSLLLEIMHGSSVLWTKEVLPGDLSYEDMTVFAIEPALENVKNQQLTLKITGQNIPAGAGTTFWYGNSQSVGKFDIALLTSETLTFAGVPVDGMLVMKTKGVNHLAAARFFWPVCLVLGVLLLAGAAYLEYCRISKPDCRLLQLLSLPSRYSYLLKQLISRDFKVRYKASMLGMLWSLLNPLLMMAVYYFVFSTLFKNNIEHFPVYLMTGIVLFNYFSESTSLGLNSIVGNASLITKVYVPKYIYPLSKALSSSINMFTSLLPVLIIMAVSGVPFTRSLLLIPYVLLCLILFSTGMCMLLSTLMTFFRDTQFLWSVLITVWNFLTPIFYPESILSAELLPYFRLNPMYQFVTFLRSICLHGVTPAPAAFLYCLLAALIPLTLGLIVFKKNQDKFVLYL